MTKIYFPRTCLINKLPKKTEKRGKDLSSLLKCASVKFKAQR